MTPAVYQAPAPPSEPPPAPLHLHLGVDLASTVLAGAGWLTLASAHPSLASTSCPCEPSEVNAFDRSATDWDWPHGEPLAHVTVGLALAIPLTSFVLDADTPGDAAKDALVLAQSVAFAGLTAQVLKTVVARPYPFLYGDPPFPEQNDDGINYASFPSGHTAVAMASMTTFAFLYQRRHPSSPWRYAVWAAAPLLAFGAGAFQMSTGNHFPTDLLGGALLGGTVGIVNPWLHTL